MPYLYVLSSFRNVYLLKLRHRSFVPPHPMWENLGPDFSPTEELANLSFFLFFAVLFRTVAAKLQLFVS